MTLATHAIVGATIGALVPDYPEAAFVFGFASHFLLDAIPHRDYSIRSNFINPLKDGKMKFDTAFFRDVVVIGGDATVGIFFALLFFARSHHTLSVVVGALAGILPDALQFVYARLKREPLVSLQHFHLWIHTKKRLEQSAFLGISTQLALVFAVVVIGRYFLNL